MKIGVFTDSHYSQAEVTCGNRYNSQSLRKIKELYSIFEEQGCDLVCCLGDLIDHDADHGIEIANLREVAQVIQEAKVPTVCLMGNHDAFSFTGEEFYQILGEECNRDVVEFGDKTLIFKDTCFYKTGVHYQPGESDWTDTFLPDFEVLEDQIKQAKGEVYLFFHQNLDQGIHESHLIANHIQVRELLAQSGKVKAVYQGHYHPGFSSVQGGIEYVTFPAVCENEGAYKILEL